MWVTTARFAHCLRCTNLFSTILNGRLYPVLNQKQAEYQVGFRKSYQTTDHFATYRLIEQKCHEWRIKMWTATVDFTKAFDSITHKSILDAHKSCNIDHNYISFLKKTYRNRKASVQTDEDSNIFEIRKGTRQGDPLSSLIFLHNSSMFIEGWNSTMAKEKRMGIYPSDHDHDLPHKLEIRRRRAAVRNIRRTASENVVWIQEKYWKRWT